MFKDMLAWPMAKLFQLLGITYLVGKISRSNLFFQGPGRLSEHDPLIALGKTSQFCHVFCEKTRQSGIRICLPNM